MVLHCAKHVVPSLLLVSERIIVEFGLVGILRLCANNPRPEALKMQRCIQSKCKVFVFHLTFIPSLRIRQGCHVKEVLRSVEQGFSRG